MQTSTASTATTRSARIAFLATPQFKEELQALAKEENVSVGALIRARFTDPGSTNGNEEERRLAELAAQLQAAVTDARESLRQGVAQARAALDALAIARHDQTGDAA